MPLTIRDAENSWLEAKRIWESFLMQFELSWNAPVILEEIAQNIQNIPPEIMERLPDDTRARLMQLRGGK